MLERIPQHMSGLFSRKTLVTKMVQVAPTADAQDAILVVPPGMLADADIIDAAPDSSISEIWNPADTKCSQVQKVPDSYWGQVQTKPLRHTMM